MLITKVNFAIVICIIHKRLLKTNFSRATVSSAMYGIAVAILSVRLSVRCVYCEKNEIIVCQYLKTVQNRISLVFPLQRRLLRIVPFRPKYSPKVTHPFRKTLTSTSFRL